MPQVADQLALETSVDLAEAPLSAASLYAWDALLADPHFILTDTNMPSQAAAREDLLAQISLAVELDPTQPIVLAEGWSDMTGFPATTADRVLWRKKVEVYNAQYLDLVAAAQAAFPTVLIQPLALASTLVALLESPAAARLDGDTLFTAAAPEGTETLTALTATLAEAAQADTPAESAPADLPAPLAPLYSGLSATAFDLVGASLQVPDIALPAPDVGTADRLPAELSFLVGTDADDILELSDAVTRVEAGDGIDTLMVAAQARTADVSTGDDGEMLLYLDAAGAPVTLVDVERIAFSDGTLAFDETGNAGQAYRLYQACFDRTPDAEGLGFWVKQLDAGRVTLNDTAALFLGSEEFASVYGNPAELADVHYLTLLYANVLDRVPDQAGFGFWRDEQANGVTRADMLVYFSESKENVAQVAPAIDDGIWYL